MRPNPEVYLPIGRDERAPLFGTLSTNSALIDYQANPRRGDLDSSQRCGGASPKESSQYSKLNAGVARTNWSRHGAWRGRSAVPDEAAETALVMEALRRLCLTTSQGPAEASPRESRPEDPLFETDPRAARHCWRHNADMPRAHGGNARAAVSEGRVEFHSPSMRRCTTVQGVMGRLMPLASSSESEVGSQAIR